MIERVENFISEEEARQLYERAERGRVNEGWHQAGNWSLPGKILHYDITARVVREFPELSLDGKCHVSIEMSHGDNAWHKDTGIGCNNPRPHLAWRKFSAEILLSPPDSFEGGDLEFREKASPIRHYCELLVYDSDKEHRVTPVTSGERIVFLMFCEDSLYRRCGECEEVQYDSPRLMENMKCGMCA